MLNISENYKKLFRDMYVPRDIRVHFPNGEMHDLTKKDIYGDGSSFRFTESLCSQKNLKFGLAEKSVIQFDTIDVENIKDSTIDVNCEVVDPDTGETVSIPYGRFEIASCQKQSDMRRRKVIAYSGAKLEVSPLTLAKLALPSLNQYSYRVDIDDLVGAGERTRERFDEQRTEEEIAGSTRGIDFDSMSFAATYKGSDGYIYTAHCDMEYKYKTVQMKASQEIDTTVEETLWYDIRSEIVDAAKAEAWDLAVKDIASYLDMLKSIVVYQESSIRRELESYVKACDTYLNHYTARMEVLQKWNNKKLRTTKDVPIEMDDIGDGIRRSRYISGAHLDVLNARGGTATTAGSIEISYDKVAESTLTFMCPYSIDVMVERAEDQETVFTRSALSGRKDILVGYYRMQRRYIMESQVPQIYPVPETPLPWVQFERTQGRDGYYYCIGAEKNLQSAISAVAEIQAKFVHKDRYGMIRFVGISDHFALYPEETIYPSEDLYPNENNGLVTTYDYSTLWYEDYEVQPYGTVVVNYKNMSGNSEVLTYRFNRANKNTYNMKDNFIFKNGGWHPDEIRQILDAWFIPGLLGIRYTPISLEMKGLPYVEAGDVFTVLTRTGGIEAFVFRRTLKGINFMTDSIEARGDEVNEIDIDDSVTTIIEEV